MALGSHSQPRHRFAARAPAAAAHRHGRGGWTPPSQSARGKWPPHARHRRRAHGKWCVQPGAGRHRHAPAQRQTATSAPGLKPRRQRQQALHVGAVHRRGIGRHAGRVQDGLLPQHFHRVPPLLHVRVHGAAAAGVARAQQVRVGVHQAAGIEALPGPRAQARAWPVLAARHPARVAHPRCGGWQQAGEEPSTEGSAAALQQVAALHSFTPCGGWDWISSAYLLCRAEG